MPEDRSPRKQAGTPEAPWARSWDEVAAELEVDIEAGLAEPEAQRRRLRFGPNRLRRAERESSWELLLRQFKSLVILMLLAAAVLSFAFGRWVDGTAISAAIVLNTLIGFVTELKAVRSMEALQQLGDVTAKVRRDGSVREVPAHEIVRGDALVFESGDLISADVRLAEAAKLSANESALTGESVPVAKQADPVDKDAALAERACMLFKGAAVTRGSGQGIVVATGMDTEIGQIASLAQEAEDETTPLERRLDRLGRRLIWITLALAALVAGSGVLAGRNAVLMIETSVALAVAAIPEGLPIVATVALARGMWRMARRNALVNRLSAVETLGSTNVICTDKTGTLTENRMVVSRIVLPTGTVEVEGEPLATDQKFRREGDRIDPSEDRLVRSALRVGVLCNNAELQENAHGAFDAVGDPMETALLAAGAAAGLRRPELLDETPEVREEAFESDTKMMATFHEQDDRYEVVVKGAPESVLPVCTHVADEDNLDELGEAGRERWFETNDRLAADGFRVLALATKRVDSAEADPYRGLTLLGLVGLLDPPRKEVREAIDACQAAGVKVVMVTGDHGLTARNIALATGLVDDPETEVVAAGEIEKLNNLSDADRRRMTEASIFARVSPEQKLALIRLHQEAGAVVAMTGDGVNDAPALKKADIGVAMGRRGTQVAREAADIVLADDALSTIVAAIKQGRGIFANIRKFIVYLLSGNVSEIMAVSAASLVGLPLPILPLQILFLNLVNDVFPALALGLGAGPGDVMRRPPRDKAESILTRRHWGAIVGYGVLIAATILLSLVLAIHWLGLPSERAISISFLTLAFARLWHVFNMRESGSGLVQNEVTTNPAVWAALALCTGLLLAAAYLPTLADILAVQAPDRPGWLLAMGLSLVPLAIGQGVKQLGSANRHDRRDVK